MPYAYTVAAANSGLSLEAVQGISQDSELLARMSQPGTFLEIAQELLALDDDSMSYLREIPSALQEAIRATVADAVTNGKAVQFQYAPAYDFGVKVWDFGLAVGVHLTGPYPKNFDRPASV